MWKQIFSQNIAILSQNNGQFKIWIFGFLAAHLNLSSTLTTDQKNYLFYSTNSSSCIRRWCCSLCRCGSGFRQWRYGNKKRKKKQKKSKSFRWISTGSKSRITKSNQVVQENNIITLLGLHFEQPCGHARWPSAPTPDQTNKHTNRQITFLSTWYSGHAGMILSKKYIWVFFLYPPKIIQLA